MRILKGTVLALAAAACAFAQAQPAKNVDSIFASSLAQSLLAADTVPISITSVTSASEFGGGFSYFAAGSWIEIKGTGLAATTRVWGGPDFSGNNAPTSIDNVKVAINGVPAYVYYVSPGQLNVQAPDDPNLLTGPIQVSVTNPSGSAATASSTKRATAPGMLAPASFNVGGKQYMVAQFADAASAGFFVGNPNLISGVAFRPAKPGESVTAYGVGFGPVTPTLAPGVIVTQLTDLAGLAVSFNSTPAVITFKGLAPNFVGLYQFNITVPNVADGDYQINMTQNGQPLPQPAMFLTVKR